MNLYYSLLSALIICSSIGIPIDTEAKSPLIIRHVQRSMKDDQIIDVKNLLIGHLLTKGTNEQKRREKRDNTGSMDVKAIQATINDHRTMIEDNRIMINNIINNSINDNSIQQTFFNHNSNTAPAWNSWRDIGLIFVIFIIIVQIFYYCACQVKLQPWDYLVSRIFQRHDTRQSQKKRPLSRPSIIDNGINSLYPQLHPYPLTFPKPLVKTVEDVYSDVHHNG